MRVVPLLLSCSIAALTAAPAVGADVILKDGSSVATSKPYVVKGKIAVLTRADGSVVSIPLDDIDLPRTAAAAGTKPAPPAAAPTPTATKKPMTPAEAALVKSGKRATVVLTDADVAPVAANGGPTGDKEKGEGEVSVGSVSATRTKTGYTISGSLMNSGKGDVRGVGVTIELLGEGGKTMQTLYGTVAKDTLSPGEKTAFTAEAASETDAKSFKYVPSWQVTVPVKAADPAAQRAEAAAAAPKAPAPPQEKAAGPAPAPKAEAPQPAAFQPVPRPDVAPPAASGSVGAPAAPGGAYVPRPSDNQAGSPKTQ